MFNTTNTYVGGGKQEVTITEHRAPTDDSIRLYGEMKDKALNSILMSGFDRLDIDFKWAVVEDSYKMCVTFYYSMEIKGRKANGRVDVYRDQLSHGTSDKVSEIAQKAVKAVSETIAECMLYDLFKTQSSNISDALL